MTKNYANMNASELRHELRNAGAMLHALASTITDSNDRERMVRLSNAAHAISWDSKQVRCWMTPATRFYTVAKQSENMDSVKWIAESISLFVYAIKAFEKEEQDKHNAFVALCNDVEGMIANVK